MLEPYYTVEEAADILRVHRVTLTRYLRERRIKAYRTKGRTGRYRISESALKSYQEEQEKLQETEG